MHLRKTRHALLDSVAASHCRAGNVANKICKCTQVCVGRGPSGGCAQLMRTLHALPPSQGAHSVMASRQHWPSSSNILHCSSGLHRSMGTSARRGHWRTASRRQPPERRRRSSPLKLRSAPCAATPNSAPTHQHKADGQCSSASGLCHLLDQALLANDGCCCPAAGAGGHAARGGCGLEALHRGLHGEREGCDLAGAGCACTRAVACAGRCMLPGGLWVLGGDWQGCKGPDDVETTGWRACCAGAPHDGFRFGQLLTMQVVQLEVFLPA